MPRLSEYWVAYLAQAFAMAGLLWSIVNSIRLRSHEGQLAQTRRDHEKDLDAVRRDHDKEIERLRTDLRREVEHGLLAEESRLRVATELRLRLHQESWKLLREIQDVTFQAFEALRTYAVDSAYSATKGNPPELKKRASDSHQAALAAVMRTSGLCHCAPPDQTALRAASSAFTKAFNDTNANALNSSEKPEWLAPIMADLNLAMKATMAGTNEWNTALWRAHDDAVTVLAARNDLRPAALT